MTAKNNAMQDGKFANATESPAMKGYYGYKWSLEVG